eukprot:7388387-Prymnesium_polylepis.2
MQPCWHCLPTSIGAHISANDRGQRLNSPTTSLSRSSLVVPWPCDGRLSARSSHVASLCSQQLHATTTQAQAQDVRPVCAVGDMFSDGLFPAPALARASRVAVRGWGGHS